MGAQVGATTGACVGQGVGEAVGEEVERDKGVNAGVVAAKSAVCAQGEARKTATTPPSHFGFMPFSLAYKEKLHNQAGFFGAEMENEEPKSKERSMPLHTYEVVIRESHLDTFGHVNNAAYLVLFEEARWEFITNNGYSLKTVQELQLGPVVLDLSMKFRRELTLREKVKITNVSEDPKGKISKFHQQMFKEDGVLAAELDVTFGLFDLKARRLVDPTPEWRKALGFA